MPHIAVKLWPSRSEEDKRAFARAVVEDAVRCLHADPAWVSVSIEEISPEVWDEAVVHPEITEKPDIQYIRSET